MRKNWMLMFGLGLVLMTLGCRQDKEIKTETVVITTEPAVYINTSITGMVIDENGQPLEGALIEVDAFQASTDDNGFFYLKDISANENGASVKATKAGFFTTSKLIYPKLGSVEFVQIKMLTSDEGGMFAAADGGDVILSSGAKLTFPEDGVTLGGLPYTGSVSVHASYIDPAANDLIERMPGSLIGLNDDGVLQGMETYGMIGVELYDDAGNELEVASDKKVVIEFPLNDALAGQAPSTIPLWHFDVSSAYWVEEGEARLNNGRYIAEVSHFSFWNCDAPFDLVNAKGRVLTADARPVANTQVVVERKGAAARGTGTAFTDYTGYFKGKIPANEFLELRVYNLCGELVSSTDIGPFNSDQDLGITEVEFPNELNISGTVVDCNFDAVTNGYAFINLGGVNVPALVDANGEFSAVIGACGKEDITVTGYDIDAQVKGNPTVYSFQTNLDVGEVSACGNVIFTLNVTIDGISNSIENCFGYTFIDSTINQNEIIYIGAEGGNGYGNMSINGNSEGTFEVVRFDFNLVDFPNIRFTESEIECTITSIEPAPSVIQGVFEGTTVNSSTGNAVDVTGDFRAERN